MKVGTFLIGNQEFALDVKSVEEVVNYPTIISNVPLNPAYVHGVFNLRGTILPIVDVATLLKLTSLASAEASKGKIKDDRKVAVVTNGSEKVGFVFDTAGEILHLRPNEINAVDAESLDTSMILGAAAFEGGKRIIEILNVKTLFAIDQLPKLNTKKRLESLVDLNLHRRKSINFRVCGQAFALEVSAIIEVIYLGEMTETVLVSDTCLGIINQRGENIAVIDFAKMMGLAESEKQKTLDPQVIIVSVGDLKIGLLIDDVYGITAFTEKDILEMPFNSGKRQNKFLGLLCQKGKADTLLLNHKEISNDQDLKAIAKGYSNIYKSKTVVKAKSTRFKRKHYLLFRLEEQLAIPIGDLQEIIRLPEDLMHPPGLAGTVHGLCNLRGDLITILDGRASYGMGSSDAEDSRVLIFNYLSSKYGVLVDSVEGIVTVDEETRISVPKILMGNRNESFENDLKEFIEVAEFNSEKKLNLIVLDFSRLFARLEAA